MLNSIPEVVDIEVVNVVVRRNTTATFMPLLQLGNVVLIVGKMSRREPSIRKCFSVSTVHLDGGQKNLYSS